MSTRKKLLILVDWFYPGYKAGGPIRSCVNLCAALSNEYDIYVLTTDTDHGETQPYPGIIADQWVQNEMLGVQVYYAKKSTLNATKIAAVIDAAGADIVYLNHLFSPLFVVYPLWLKWRHKINATVVVCPRGALYDSALNVKAYKKRPLLFLYKWAGIHHKIRFHATNEREQKAIEKYFPGAESVIADNLPKSRSGSFVSVKKEAGEISCIFVARIVPIKNLLFLLQLLQQVTVNTRLTIAGPVEDEQYWNECKNAINALPANITVNYAGAVANNQLTELIQQHHLFVLPTQGENFGHSVLEALMAGRPVLISDQTPWLQLEKDKAGWDISLQSPHRFAAVINELGKTDQLQYNVYAMAAWQYAGNYIETHSATKQYHILFS